MNNQNNKKKDPICNIGIFKCLYTIEGKKGVFSIILVATILTVFELILFYKTITPSVADSMNSNLNNVSNEIYNNINNLKPKLNINNDNNKLNNILKTLSKNNNINLNNSILNNSILNKGFRYTNNLVFNDKFKAILNTFSDREKKLTGHINNYTVISGLLLLVILIIFLIILWINIKKSKLEENENKNMSTSIYTAFLTVGILISFQILFFFFGKKYNYPGSLGNEELARILLNEINPK